MAKSNCTYSLPDTTKQKLVELRAYHGKSYNDLISLIVDNAYLKMSESLNEDKVNSLTESDNNLNFQVQQLTLIFGSYKTELEKLKLKQEKLESDNAGLKNIVNQQTDKHNEFIGTIESMEKAIGERLTRHSNRITNIEDENKKGLLSKFTGK